MKTSWYQKCMPRVKDIKPNLQKIAEQIKKIEGVQDIYVWGSYARNHDNPQFRVKDVDIIVKNAFNSGDLIALDKSILSSHKNSEFLEEQGFSPEAIKFSRELLAFTKYNIDHWAISADKKLLHWGAIAENREEADGISEQAEKYASDQTGYNRKKVNNSSNNIRNNWYELYHDYMSQFFTNMPSGWYRAEDANIKEIIKNTIKL